MAIYRKEHLAPYLRELEAYYLALRHAVEGAPPNDNLAEQYHANPEQFRSDFAEVDLAYVLYQVEHFRAAVNYLRQLKGEQTKPVRG
jgi:FMN phosphatase YigB (HAD superfamily)